MNKNRQASYQPLPLVGKAASPFNGEALKLVNLGTSLRVFCETSLRRADPELAFTAKFDLALGAGNGRK